MRPIAAFALFWAVVTAGIWALVGCTTNASSTSTVVQTKRTYRNLDIAHGARLFSANCARCHGATGREGGFGPSLSHEDRKMDLDTAIAWIEKPLPPMPALYPSPLNAHDVADVAAYVRSL